MKSDSGKTPRASTASTSEDDSQEKRTIRPKAKSGLEDNILNPQDLVGTLRNLTNMGSKDIIGSLIDKVNMGVDGGQLIQAAIAFEKNEMLQYYISKGANVDLPPDTVSKLYIDYSRKPEYRKSPFIIQAASQGDLGCFETLIHHDCKITDTGFIGFSRKRKNQVISNVTGAAAFHGGHKILKHILKHPSTANINFLASEKKDFNATGAFNKEYTGYTPIMLAAAGGGQNLECVKQLVQAKADLSIQDPVGNTVMHIAAYHQNHLVLEFILDHWPAALKLDLAIRNKKGDTAFSIANLNKDEKTLTILKRFESKFGDLTETATKNLLDDLLKEELKQEQEKQKRKDKKKQHKLKHIAENQGLTVEELQARHQQENEEKRREEDEAKRLEEERIRRDFEQAADEQRRREARERAIFGIEEEQNNGKPQVTERKPRTVNNGTNGRSKSVKFADEVQTQQSTLVETQFSHNKIRRPEPSERPAIIQKVAATEEPVNKLAPKEDPAGPNRKQRKTQEWLKQKELRKREGGDQTQAQTSKDAKEEEKVEGATAAAANDSSSDDEPEAPEIQGLSNELKLKMLQGKARQRLRRKIQAEEEKERAEKERIKKAHEDKETERVRKLQEEEQARKEEEKKLREAKRAEKASKLAAQSHPASTATAGSQIPANNAAHYRAKQTANDDAHHDTQNEAAKLTNKKEKKEPKEKDTPAPQKQVYRAKTKIVDEREPVNHHEDSKVEKVSKEVAHTDIQQVKAPIPVVEKEPIETPPSSPNPTQQQVPVQQTLAFNAPPPGFPFQLPGFNLFQAGGYQAQMIPTHAPVATSHSGENPLIHQHLQQLQQIILAKDQELILHRQRTATLEADLAHHAQQTQALQAQLKSASSHHGSSTDDSSSAMKEQIAKESQLNQVLNSKLMETEKALRDEQAKRKIAEDKLFSVLSQKQQQVAQSHIEDSEVELLELANAELSRKEVLLRESKKQSEFYTGQNLDKRSRPELQQAQKQLGDVVKIINSLLEHSK